MENFIKNLEISHFKSIKDLKLDCKRVNVFIGKPNVGKSNILEALGLLGVYFMDDNRDFLSKNMFRYETIADLFFDKNIVKQAVVSCEYGAGILRNVKNDEYELISGPAAVVKKILDGEEITDILEHEFVEHVSKSVKSNKISFDSNGKIIGSPLFGTTGIDVQRYIFKQIEEVIGTKQPTLLASMGLNLFDIVLRNKVLQEEIGRKLAEYGLSFVLSQSPSKFLIQKKENDFFAIQYPYSSIADTLQRFIFYLAAVESNTNSVLIFEEPEVHSFPPYVKELAERMILKDDNQYFVSTHSPYLLQTFIDSLDHAELNVYLTYYRNYQTHVKALSAEELRDIQDFGYDVFFNLRKFEPNE